MQDFRTTAHDRAAQLPLQIAQAVEQGRVDPNPVPPGSSAASRGQARGKRSSSARIEPPTSMGFEMGGPGVGRVRMPLRAPSPKRHFIAETSTPRGEPLPPGEAGARLHRNEGSLPVLRTAPVTASIDTDLRVRAHLRPHVTGPKRTDDMVITANIHPQDIATVIASVEAGGVRW